MRAFVEEYTRLKDKRVVLLQSGGLDSTICAAFFSKYGFEIDHLFVDYGQNAVYQEWEAVQKVAEVYPGNVHYAKIELPWLSSATVLAGGEVRDWHGEGGLLNTVREMTYVPMRNMFLLSMAASLAEAKKIPNIGAALDGSQTLAGKPYSGTTDKHPAFVNKVAKAFTEGSTLHHIDGGEFKILTPVMGLYKYQIVQFGEEIGADMSISWSCYNKSEKGPCMKCSACRVRAEGFKKAHVQDPLLKKFGIFIK